MRGIYEASLAGQDVGCELPCTHRALRGLMKGISPQAGISNGISEGDGTDQIEAECWRGCTAIDDTWRRAVAAYWPATEIAVGTAFTAPVSD